MQEDRQEEPYLLRQKLLDAVDTNYNVQDMSLIHEVLGKLEVLPVTKEILESTRLGKTVNEFRRRVNDTILAKRLKALVKKWRDAVLVDDIPRKHIPVNGSSSVGLVEGAQVGTVNRSLPSFSSGYTSASSSPTLVSSRVSPADPHNSNSLSPRIGTVTNYNNNNTSVHSVAANRNGSSSIASRSPSNHRNPQPPLSSYSTLVSPSASSASPLLNSRHLASPSSKTKSPGGPWVPAFNSSNSNLSPLPISHIQSTKSSYAPNAETVSRTNAANKRYRELDDSPVGASAEPPSKKSRSAFNGSVNFSHKTLDWGDSDGDDDDQRKGELLKSSEDKVEVFTPQEVQVTEESAAAVVDTIESVTTEEVTIELEHEFCDSEPIPIREVNDEDVEKYIKEDVPNLNGNYDKEGQFREWHETLTVDSYKGEPLHILPYTIIDF